MNRVFNFSAGPSMLPLPVLERAASEMHDYNGSGQSVMEMSHRSAVFQEIIDNARNKLRKLMGIPEDYEVLFLQGGASLQFAMLAINLRQKGKAAYVDTGIWSDKAFEEGKRWIDAENIASSKADKYTYIPQIPTSISSEYDYIHITHNNTIVGTKWAEVPTQLPIPLVADISSSILSEPMNVQDYGLLYAGAQKNIGPAGLTVVVIKKELIRKDLPEVIPTLMRYDTFAKNDSMYNTPPCYAIYIMSLVMDWIEELGGAEAVGQLNRQKANLLYDYIDNSGYYHNVVVAKDRSMMNIPFLINGEDREKLTVLEKSFVQQAFKEGLVNLGGHRLVGGMRASIYNAMPIEGVETLVQFMKRFAKENPI